MTLLTVPISPLAPERFEDVLTAQGAEQLRRTLERGRRELAGRVIWNVNSTANGGGVAEMLRSLIAYGRGGGVDARWVVIEGTPRFFALTKRLHNRLHGQPGDGGRLGQGERAVYETASEHNAHELAKLVSPGDIVLLHDPQTAGMVPAMRSTGAHVIWRSHIGLDSPNRLARSAWRFLLPYVTQADRCVFSRRAYAWDSLDDSRVAVIPPSIDAFSPKNQPLSDANVRAILRVTGLVRAADGGRPMFTRQDGTPGRVDRPAQIVEDVPLEPHHRTVVQVSRWDRLKDPIGVIDGFVAHVLPRADVHLVLAGPEVDAVSDDPEGAAVLAQSIAHRAELKPEPRSRVHLASLPMDDAEENAAVVNALQRHADVVVQKSLAEGFGLTVAEAMWKARPVVASRIGGIQDQVVDGESGLLVEPGELERFGDAVFSLLSDPQLAARIGAQAQERVREAFLGPRHLTQLLDLFAGLIAAQPERQPITGRAAGT